MDTGQYSTLMDALKDIPDPRKRRGKRHHWQHLLLVLLAGLASGYQTARAIAHWAHLHTDSFLHLVPSFTCIPSESTLLRTLRQIDSARLDQRVTAYTATLSTAIDHSGCIVTLQGEILQGQALDGKTVRGAGAHGDKTHLLSLVQHGSGVTVAQREVATKQNEITVAPLLLRDSPLSGTVTTSDALLTQRTQAQTIRACDGHYLMIVKRNSAACGTSLNCCFASRRLRLMKKSGIGSPR